MRPISPARAESASEPSAVEDAAEIGGSGGQCLGRFRDAHREPLVRAFEIAQDVAGASSQRLRRFDGAGNQLLVGDVEGAGDLAGAGGQLVGGFLGAGHERVRRVVGARHQHV